MERNQEMMMVLAPKYVSLDEGWTETSPILGRERKEMENLKDFRGIPKRYILTIMCSLGLVLVYAMRVNLSVALVAMVKKVPVDNSSLYIADGGEFDWSPYVQGQILGSFFYGYVVTQLPGGVLAQRYGGSWLFGGGVLFTAIFTLLSPAAARWNFSFLISVRVLMGLAEGVTYPALNALIGKWIPENERSKLASVIFSGSTVGTLISMALSGLLCSSDFMGGWPASFYVFGFFGIIWFAFWFYLIYESPDVHPTISGRELMTIKKDQKEIPRDLKTPWKSILTSRFVWALAATHFAQNWGFYTLLTELPNYMANILNFNIKTNGVLNAIPYLIQPFISISAGLAADKFRSRGHYRITTIRKIFNSLAFFIPSVCIGLIPVFGRDAPTIFALLTISLAANGMIHSGFNVTHVDMSPIFAGTLMGFTNCIANLSGFLAPSFVSRVIEGGQTIENWGIVFTVTAGVFFIGGVIYNLFCSAERQPWNNVTPTSSDTDTVTDVVTTEVVDRPR